MFVSFIKIALRFLWRNKTYTILNYLCLTFGLTCAITAALNIIRVLDYDKFHKNYNTLYEVEANVTYFNGDRFPKELLSASLPDLIKEGVPEVKSLSRVVNSEHIFIIGNESFTERGIYADTTFLSMFSFPLLRGSGKKVLADDKSIIISEKMAIKLFNTTDCIGRTLMLKDDSVQKGYSVSGVLKQFPSQSVFMFDFIIPFSEYLSSNSWAYGSGASANQVWAQLFSNKDADIVNGKIKTLIKGQETTLNQELFLFPLKEKVLYAYIGGRRVWGEMQNIVIIGCIGLAILLIACFNFINLAIALNIRRYREAGIKKVVGAHNISIITQILGETSIITLLSILTAVDLVKLTINSLNMAFNGNVSFNFSDIRILILFAGAFLFTTITSGLLPALYLSSSKPVNILKGRIVTSHSFSFFRKSLIVFQFTLPVVLIICMIIVKTQDSFIRKYDLGFDKNKLLIINKSNGTGTHTESIRNDLLSVPGIESVSFSSCIPAQGAGISNEVGWEGKDPATKLHFWCIATDFDYAKTVNLKISEGRYFERSHPSDSACFLINDVAAKVMGYDKPIGRTMMMDGNRGTIIGIFREFHTLGLAGPYTPTIISLSKSDPGNLLISIGEGDYSEIQGRIKDIFSKYEPDNLTQARLYSDLTARTELTTVTYLIGLAFVISIVLACMGLSGLASFTAAARTKEIGIRKINGATVSSIMRLLGFNFFRLLTIASVIALPLAFMVGNFFLSRFSFRTPMPYLAFLGGPALAYLIALSAVGFQSWRAATRNPVEALRYE